ncbi:hypothetical protein M5D96_012510 [Drosophila gunungcola]|uniref:Uncharacterized protein n=1 Tax=Drosophila gunungcola TaxID=103775 RepID=A0A9Q0BJQ4_9MUSC|nr:hypothetical protein M5D96_012510 [Drosophila gunungcola]
MLALVKGHRTVTGAAQELHRSCTGSAQDLLCSALLCSAQQELLAGLCGLFGLPRMPSLPARCRATCRFGVLQQAIKERDYNKRPTDGYYCRDPSVKSALLRECV